MHPTVAAFWGWHLIEEIEHRSVAFEVYQRCVGDERLRVRAMAHTTLLFSVLNFFRTARLMCATGSFWSVPAWRQGLELLFGRGGALTRARPLYFAFYRRDFHPDQHDLKLAVERAKAQYIVGHERVSADPIRTQDDSRHIPD
jgi:hypothetical protein